MLGDRRVGGLSTQEETGGGQGPTFREGLSGPSTPYIPPRTPKAPKPGSGAKDKIDKLQQRIPGSIHRLFSELLDREQSPDTPRSQGQDSGCLSPITNPLRHGHPKLAAFSPDLRPKLRLKNSHELRFLRTPSLAWSPGNIPVPQPSWSAVSRAILHAHPGPPGPLRGHSPRVRPSRSADNRPLEGALPRVHS